jgi:trimeric autotransporter adhesin
MKEIKQILLGESRIRIKRNLGRVAIPLLLISTAITCSLTTWATSPGYGSTATSSRRFKEDIKPMNDASEALFAFRPVTFRYKKEIDSRGIPQFGLIAEDVEKVNPDLVVRDNEGNVNTVRYEQINAMLLNEFLKEHKAFIEEQGKVKKLEAGLADLLATVKEQAAQIQKVSAKVEMTKPASQLAANKP